ncbi:hypothetical protein BJ742DRAFT_88710 [Cladochytrium replicatum]|nr:hypothetical protein BJ742DRAFT_88710 [Cladochytrium replicatum]
MSGLHIFRTDQSILEQRAIFKRDGFGARFDNNQPSLPELYIGFCSFSPLLMTFLLLANHYFWSYLLFFCFDTKRYCFVANCLWTLSPLLSFLPISNY